MTELESATRRLGKEFIPQWGTMISKRKNGTGWMVWDDLECCIVFDFFGYFDPSDKVKLSEMLIIIHHRLELPYGLRIGFHQTENDAKRLMLAMLGCEDPQDGTDD
jgi:hypothetical protein